MAAGKHRDTTREQEKGENRSVSTNQTGRCMRRDFYTEWQRIQLYESEREESVNMARC